MADLDPIEPDRSGQRFAVITLLRLAGAFMTMFGLVAIAGRVAGVPPVAGYVLLVIGLADFALMPWWLAMRWSTRVK